MSFESFIERRVPILKSARTAILRRKRQITKPPNPNRPSQYRWLEDLLYSIVDGSAAGSVSSGDGGPTGTPLFAVAGGCPNRMCGMQAVVYCQVGQAIDFWWVKPQECNPNCLEPRTLTKKYDGPFRNAADKSQKLYQPLADKFAGDADGTFLFGIDESGRAFIEEEVGGNHQKRRMFVYMVWQEHFSSFWDSTQFVEGKICYEVSSPNATEPHFFARPYKFEGSKMWLAPAADEDMLPALLLPDFQGDSVMM